MRFILKIGNEPKGSNDAPWRIPHDS
jgi:hypothetical protein